MALTAATSTEAPAAERAPAPLRIVFFLNRFTYIRFFESVLRSLVERGHDVVLLLERAPTHDYEERWVEDFERDPRFSWRRTKALKSDPLHPLRRDLRKTVDYLRFLGPRFEHARSLSRRAVNRTPARVVGLSRLPVLRSRWALRLATAVLEGVDHALPAPQALLQELDGLDPDLVVVSPHGMPGSRDSEYLKAAKALGIPTAVAVASWDNLSSKQLLHERPDRLLVWNETQKREATELHDISGDRVVVTGAQNFDLWFDWRPSDRQEFCRSLGVDPDKPYVLYLGGSLYPAEITEAEWARRWIAALRSSGDPVLASAGVLLRPHPCRVDDWREVPFDEHDNVALWQCEYREMPVAEDARAEFYDSIYHSAAVVGLNTSAMIEAAIVGRSVHTLLVPEFEGSQKGVFHFEYLLTVGGGLPRVAHSLDEHLLQLAETLTGADETAERRRRRFLEEFVRPQGLERPSTPIFVEALEELAAVPVRADRLPAATAGLRALLAAAIWLLTLRGRTRNLRRRSTRAWKRVRRARPGRRARRLAARARPVKRLRRFVRVWLFAAVRVRVQRLRNRLRLPKPSPELVWSDPRSACTSCGSSRLRKLDYVRSEQGDVHSLVSGCESCGLVFVNPPPSEVELAARYGHGGRWQRKLTNRARSDYKSSRAPAASVVEATHPHDSFVGVIRELGDRNGRGHVLDFGCGGGELLDELQDMGWRTTGIDPAPNEITRHELLDAMPDTATYDLIVMRHVLEHLTDPLATLRAARAAILDGGHLLVGVPRLDGVAEHGKKRYCLNALHVTAYTERSLRNLLGLAGFETVRRLELPKPYRLALLARAASSSESVNDPLRDARRELRRTARKEHGRWRATFTSIESRAARDAARLDEAVARKLAKRRAREAGARGGGDRTS